MKENSEIKEAMSELKKISEDEELRRVAELREKAIRDEKNGLRHAKEEGMKEGMKEGIKEGMKEGIKEGIEKGKKQVAKRMLNLNMPLQDIINATDLTEEQILNIKKSIK